MPGDKNIIQCILLYCFFVNCFVVCWLQFVSFMCLIINLEEIFVHDLIWLCVNFWVHVSCRFVL